MKELKNLSVVALASLAKTFAQQEKNFRQRYIELRELHNMFLEEKRVIQKALFSAKVAWAKEVLETITPEEGVEFSMNPEPLEPLFDDRQVVVCFIKNHTGGRAICSNEDRFSYSIGKAIAYLRALDIAEEIPKWIF